MAAEQFTVIESTNIVNLTKREETTAILFGRPGVDEALVDYDSDTIELTRVGVEVLETKERPITLEELQGLEAERLIDIETARDAYKDRYTMRNSGAGIAGILGFILGGSLVRLAELDNVLEDSRPITIASGLIGAMALAHLSLKTRIFDSGESPQKRGQRAADKLRIAENQQPHLSVIQEAIAELKA